MKKSLCLISLIAIITPGCLNWGTKKSHNSDKGHAMKQMQAEELRENMAKDKEMVVVNVLEADTYKDCHIKGSINIPYNELEEKTKTWEKNKKIVVYCASYTCSASKKAYETLANLNFTNVYAYEGGMKEWSEKNFEKEGDCQASYLK